MIQSESNFYRGGDKIDHIVIPDISSALVHMWFADHVTMLWSNGLWFHELFATLMENVCLSQWQSD